MIKHRFKTMFIFLNDRMRTFISPSISYLSAALKNAGYPTCIFDTSFYEEQERLKEEKKKEDAGIFVPVDYDSIGVNLKSSSLIDDLIQAIEIACPALICFSVFSQSAEICLEYANIIKDKYPNILIIMGGIHVSIYPERILSEDYVDFVCVGEGEEAIVDLVNCLSTGKSIESIKNLGFKRDNKIILNKVRKPQDMDKLPFPDWELFENYHQYGPFRGKLLKMALVECTRTCPYKCSFCGNNVFKQHYKEAGYSIGYRHKSPKKWVSELKKMKEEYGTEFINIIDGTFVAQKESVFEELAELYAKDVALPFFCDATVNCITPKKIQFLKKMGCVCVNMGIESGNEKYRYEVLDKYITNSKIIDSFHLIKEAGIETRGYNIIGLPFQTRENIMETIELNRKAKVNSISLSIFMPYDGTSLRDYCIKNKLVDPEIKITGDGTEPIIYNPYLSNEDLMGLYKTFSLYVLAPRKYFSEIKKAEGDTKEAEKIRGEILKNITSSN